MVDADWKELWACLINKSATGSVANVTTYLQARSPTTMATRREQSRAAAAASGDANKEPEPGAAPPQQQVGAQSTAFTWFDSVLVGRCHLRIYDTYVFSNVSRAASIDQGSRVTMVTENTDAVGHDL
eukprot:4824382-Karenia_brevis.AAC.1